MFHKLEKKILCIYSVHFLLAFTDMGLAGKISRLIVYVQRKLESILH